MNDINNLTHIKFQVSHSIRAKIPTEINIREI